MKPPRAWPPEALPDGGLGAPASPPAQRALAGLALPQVRVRPMSALWTDGLEGSKGLSCEALHLTVEMLVSFPALLPATDAASLCRDRRVLQEWREQAQVMKKKEEELGRLRPPRRMPVCGAGGRWGVQGGGPASGSEAERWACTWPVSPAVQWAPAGAELPSAVLPGLHPWSSWPPGG